MDIVVFLPADTVAGNITLPRRSLSPGAFLQMFTKTAQAGLSVAQQSLFQINTLVGSGETY